MQFNNRTNTVNALHIPPSRHAAFLELSQANRGKPRHGTFQSLFSLCVYILYTVYIYNLFNLYLSDLIYLIYLFMWFLMFLHASAKEACTRNKSENKSIIYSRVLYSFSNRTEYCLVIGPCGFEVGIGRS